jgi:hypothetical protein
MDEQGLTEEQIYYLITANLVNVGLIFINRDDTVKDICKNTVNTIQSKG